MAEQFERALGYWGRDIVVQMLRGPGSPWRRMHAARERLDRVLFAEISRRRQTGDRGTDILSLLLDATDEDGSSLSDTELRDQVMTLLFAGHDTTTSTLTFLFYELARNPGELPALEAERDEAVGDRDPNATELVSSLPRLDMALDETLRMYPPAWIGPRRSLEPFELCGVHVPGDSFVNYSSWASHRLPEVLPEPDRFLPERFTPEAKAALPKGAYVPFGGGSRTCIGMRFGQFEIKAIAAMLLRRFRLELDRPGARAVDPADADAEPEGRAADGGARAFAERVSPAYQRCAQGGCPRRERADRAACPDRPVPARPLPRSPRLLGIAGPGDDRGHAPLIEDPRRRAAPP